MVGTDAPTPARGQGLQPYGALTLFFRWRKKSVQKKASGTATPEAARPAARRGLRPAVAPSGLSSSSVRFAHPPGKRLLCPFWRRGSLCRAQQSWPAYACYRARSELAFFRRQNGRAFFPPLPIAALLPRSWRWAGLPLAGWDDFLLVGRFWKVIGQRVRRARAMRPVAEWRSALAKRQGAAPDRRDVAPVVPRR